MAESPQDAQLEQLLGQWDFTPSRLHFNGWFAIHEQVFLKVTPPDSTSNVSVESEQVELVGADVGAGVVAMVGYAVTSITSTTGATVTTSSTSTFASSVRPVEAASSITAAVNAPLATALSTDAKTASPSSVAVLALLSSHPSAEQTAVEVNSYSTSIDCI